MHFSLRRISVALGSVAVLLLVGYTAVSWLFSERLIGQKFAPLGAVDVAAFDLPQPEEVTFEGDGVTLAGWYFANPRNEGCAVVMLHGFGGSRAEVLAPSPIFWARGCDLFLYDARGHGDSSPSLLSFGAHEHKDLLQAVDWLAGRTGLDHSRIGLMGWSYGAATALLAAPEVSDLAFVVADSSFSSLRDIASVQAEGQYGAWARIFVPGALFVSSVRSGFGRGDAAPVDHIDEVRVPVLLIHSRTDGFTPAEHSEQIYEQSNKERTRLVIPDWDAPHAPLVLRGHTRLHRDRGRLLERPRNTRVRRPPGALNASRALIPAPSNSAVCRSCEDYSSSRRASSSTITLPFDSGCTQAAFSDSASRVILPPPASMRLTVPGRSSTCKPTRYSPSPLG